MSVGIGGSRGEDGVEGWKATIEDGWASILLFHLPLLFPDPLLSSSIECACAWTLFKPALFLCFGYCEGGYHTATFKFVGHIYVGAFLPEFATSSAFTKQFN